MSSGTEARTLKDILARLDHLEALSQITYDSDSFVPVLAGSIVAGTFTYTVQAGSYTRDGNTVLFRCRVSISAIAVAPTGNLTITGLPITSVTIGGGSGIAGGAALMFWQGLTLPAGYTQVMANILAATTVINLTRGGSNVAAANVAGGELVLVGGVAHFYMQGQYQVA